MITKHYLYASSTASRNKSEAEKAAPIFVNNIKNKEIRTRRYELTKIKETILKGYTVNFGMVKSKTLLALDIDNNGPTKLNHNHILKCLNDINIIPNLIFETYSHTTSHPKYRVVIALDKPIKDDDLYIKCIKGIATYINGLYPDTMDTSPANVLSLYYPSKKCIYEDTDNLTAQETIIKTVSCILPDTFIDIKLSDFLLSVLLKSELISQEEYERYMENKTYYRVIFNKAVPNQYYLDISMYIGVDDILTKDNILPDISILCSYKNNILDIPFNPIVKRNIKVKRYLINQIKKGVLTKLLNCEEKVFFQDMFNCDENIKATIMTTDKGEQRYYIYDVSGDKPKLLTNYSVIDFLVKLLGLKDHMELMNFINKLCNISLDDIPSYSRKKKITDYRNAITNYFDRYKNLKAFLYPQDNSFVKDILDCILEIAYDFYEYRDKKVGNSQSTYELQIYALEKTIYDRLLQRNIRIDKSNVSKKVILLAKLGLIEYVPIDEYDVHTLALRKNLKNRIKFSKGQPHVFYIPDYNLDLFKKADKIAKGFLDKGFGSFLMTHNMNTIKNHEYCICLNNLVKKHFDEDHQKYLVRSDLIKMFQEHYPDKNYRATACILTKYMPIIIQENKLNLYTLKLHNLWHFNLTEKTATEKGYVLSKSRVYCKNIMED